MYDYYDSAEGIEITANRARQEIESHGCSWSEFLLDNDISDMYDAQQVLEWLGY